jgi:hypothetical protein
MTGACSRALVALIAFAGTPVVANGQLVRPFAASATGAVDLHNASDARSAAIAALVAKVKGTTPENQQALVEAFQVANRVVRDSQDAVLRYLSAFDLAPDLLASTPGIATSGSYIELSLDTASLDAAVGGFPDSIKQAILVEALEIKDRVKRLTGNVTTVTLYADGAIRGALDGSGGGSTAGTGSIGLSVAYPKGWGISASVGVAGTVDTVRSGYGAVLLVPGAGKGALSNFVVEGNTPSVNLSLKKFKIALPVVGYGYVAASNSLWEVADSSGLKANPATKVVTLDANAASVATGVGARFLALNGRLLSTDVNLALSVGYAWRALEDAAGANTAIRALALNGNPRTIFHGWEWGMELGIGEIRAAVHYYTMGRSSLEPQVTSLTGGVWVIGLSAAANVVSGPLTKP